MKFKIDDKVTYTGKHSSFVPYNSAGVVTYIDTNNKGYNVLFFLNNPKYEWFCIENNLVKTPTKNGQLVFNFYRKLIT